MSLPFDPERPCGTHAKGPTKYKRKELEEIAHSLGILHVSSKNMDTLCTEIKEKSVVHVQAPSSEIDFDPNRPCGTHAKGSNKYTRKELEGIARLLGIQKISSKNMNELCTEIQTLVSKKKSVPQKTMTVPPSQTILPFDPSRPCGTHAKGSNKYTRQELEKIARSLGINGIKQKTMDQLCKEINNNPEQKQQEAIDKTKEERCLIDITRPCGSKTKGKKRYTMKQLKTLWNKECTTLEEFRGVKIPTKLDDVCKLLTDRYKDIKFLPVKRVPVKVIETLKKWFEKRKRKPINPKKTELRLLTKIYSVRSLGNKKLLNLLVNDTAGLNAHMNPKTYTIPRTGYYGYPYSSLTFSVMKARTYPNYLYNRNVDGFPTAWILEQEKYITSLPWQSKYRLLCYTFGGDKIVNSFLLGAFVPASAMTNFKENYNSSYLFPLALEIHLHAQTFDTSAEWTDALTDNLQMTIETAGAIFAQLKGKEFDAVYEDIFIFMKAQGLHIRVNIWTAWITSYIEGIRPIFNNAPPVPKGGIFVYRGVKESHWVVTNPSNVFRNVPFMSTSLGITEALRFKTLSSNCCLFVIQVLPGSKCLFASILSYFDHEAEVLFPPGSRLFLTRRERKAENANLLVTYFALVN